MPQWDEVQLSHQEDSCSGGGDGEEEEQQALPDPPIAATTSATPTCTAAAPASAKVSAASTLSMKPPAVKGKRISLASKASTSATVQKGSRSVCDTKDSKVYYLGQSNGYKLDK